LTCSSFLVEISVGIYRGFTKHRRAPLLRGNKSEPPPSAFSAVRDEEI
jgi:hypothetical protein